jgi:peptidoglycan/LPS O-acetylase OafA/YrhL
MLPHHFKYRPDIDGLRTIAVSAVILFHAFPSLMAGGFIGVDIFFVISGYLITGLILKETSQATLSKKIFNFTGFYARRIRRIFPALIIVISSCLVAGWYLLLSDEYKELGKEVFFGGIFIENLSLWQEAGYFDTAAELKPLLHLWSLGVEEQFYLAWPFFLILSIRRHWNTSLTISSIAILSFIFNIALTYTDSSAAFYLPISRIWQFMAGAILANTQFACQPPSASNHINHPIPLFSSNSSRNNSLSILGVSCILIVAWGIDESFHFPGWWALFPTIGTCLIIAAGPHAWINRHFLGNRFLVFVGLISYPLYLWHWPLLYFSRVLQGGIPSPTIRIIAIMLSAGLAYLTYITIEVKIRYKEHRNVIIFLLIAIAFLSLIGHNVFDRDGLQFRLKGSELQRVKFNSALSYQDQCRHSFPFAKNSFCLRGNENMPPTVALIGDSHAQSLFHGLGLTYSNRGENLINFGAGGGIPLFDLERKSGESISTYNSIFDSALNYSISNPNIKTIILMNKSLISSGADKDNLIYKPQPEIQDPIEAYGIALAKTFEKLLTSHKQIIFIIDNPSMDFDPASCLPRPSSPSPTKVPCAIPRIQYDLEIASYRKKINQVLSQYPEVKLWDISNILCDKQYCWAMRDEKMLYNRDGTHLSVVGSHWLANYFPY